jgi:hypothetical protein
LLRDFSSWTFANGWAGATLAIWQMRVAVIMAGIGNPREAVSYVILHRSALPTPAKPPLCAASGDRHTVYVGLCEVAAAKQQRRSPASCQRIGEAVAVVQSRRMPTFAKTPPCHSGDLGLILIDRHDLDPAAIDQQVEFAAARVALAAFDDNGRFQEVGGGEQAWRAGFDPLGDVAA